MRGALMAVVLLPSLAGCGGAVVLPDDPVQRAATCGVVSATQARATIADIKAPLSAAQQGDVLRHALVHASASGRYEADAAGAVVEAMPALGGKLDPDRVARLAPLCAAAFPPPPAKAELPDDPLTAMLGCDELGKFMTRALEPQADDYGSELTRLAMLNRGLDDRIAPVLRQRGIAGVAQTQPQAARAFAAIVKAGRPMAVIEACEARYSPKG